MSESPGSIGSTPIPEPGSGDPAPAPPAPGETPTRRRPRGCLVILLLAINLLLAAGNVLAWGPGWSMVERVASGKVERSVGKARSLQVHVWSTRWLDLLAGRVGLLRLDAHRLRLKNGLRVADIAFVAQGLRATPDSVQELGAVRWFVRVREADLNRFLKRRAGLLHPVPTVRLRPGEMEVTARQMFIDLPIRVRGGLRVEDGTRIHFDVALGADVKTLVVAGAMAYLNPIVDLRDPEMAPLGVSIGRLELRDQGLEVEGTAAPPLPFMIPRKPEVEPSPEPDDDDDEAPASPSPS